MRYSSSLVAKPNLSLFDIPAMKARLPLPALLELLGLGAHSQQSAFCPFHENTNTKAFSVYKADRGWRWHCYSQCGDGDEIDFIVSLEKCSRSDAIGAGLSTVRTWRAKRLIPYIKTGHKSVIYDLPKVLAALEEFEVKPVTGGRR